MDLQKILNIIKSFEDGALTDQEAIELLNGIIYLLDKIRPTIKKWFFRVLLDGVKVTLTELKDHLEINQEEKNGPRNN